MTSYSLKSIFAPLPVTSRAKTFHLQTDPKNEKLLYCSGQAVVVRDLKNPADCYTYSEHSAAPTAACFAPSGYYIASGDSHGKVRVWDTTLETHLLKYECSAMGGAIKDICWSPDSKRILVGGAGRSKRTHCFLWDSGSSCGLLHGHGKDVNAVAHKTTRPFRAVTASEDFSVVFHSGVPYKYDFAIKKHENFVNSVRFSPDGNNFCTVSSDKRALLFDGMTGKFLKELEFKDGVTAHNGGIMSVSYKDDNSQLITASADKTVRLWDIEASKCISTLEFGTDVADQQLGCLWAGEFVLSVSFSGNINYIDVNANCITRTLKGHQKSIETMEVAANKIYTTSFDGRVCMYDAGSGDVEYFTGVGHKHKVMDTKVSDDKLVSADIECNGVRSTLANYKMGESSYSLPSRPCCLDVQGGIEVYTCEKPELVMFKGGNQVFSKDLSYEPFGCALSPSGTVLAVGAKSEPKLYLYDIVEDTIVQRQDFDLVAIPTEIRFSPDGAFLGAATAGRHVVLLDVNNYYKAVTHCWSCLSKTLTCAFSPNSRYLAIAGIDTNILVCDVSDPMSAPIKILRAHPLGTINRVRWLDDNTVVSTGSDMQIRQHTINSA